MTQEEKLEEAQRLYKTANQDQRYVLEKLFPELAESEDEKIRKSIVKILTKIVVDTNYRALGIDFSIKDMIAWLEKQGVQNPADLEEFINELSKQFPDVSFAKLSRIAVRVAKWAKPADSHCLDCTNAKGCVNCTDGDMKETEKPAWSEDGKKHIIDIIDYLDDYYSFAKDEDKNVADGVQNEIRWLQRI